MSSASFYAGPARARLQLRAWEDVEIAAAAGLLEESAWIELKEAVPAASRAANRELAKDLASLSVDGGLLVVGVSDKLEVVGCVGDASALRTRLVQVAAAGITPSLFVEVEVLTTEKSGVLRHLALVRVPSSNSAPHMVDDQYWGRSAEGKRPLSDAEIERLMTERRLRPSRLDKDLRELDDDLGPLGNGAPEHAHLSFVARPEGIGSSNMIDALEGDYPPQVLNDAADFQAQWSPWGSLGHHFSFHPEGILLSSDDSRFGHVVDEENSYRVLLRNDGAVLGLAGGVSHTMDRPAAERNEAIVCGYLLEGVHTLSRLAGYLGAEHLSYWADWEIGVLITEVKGLYATDRYYSGSLEHHAFPRAEYEQRTTASTRELLEHPSAVTERLLLPMLRTLGVATRWLPYERGEQIADRRSR